MLRGLLLKLISVLSNILLDNIRKDNQHSPPLC